MARHEVPARLLRPSAPGLRRHPAALRLCGGLAVALAAGSLRVCDTLLLWLERYRQRRALDALSDHMLKDLGLSRVDAGRESGKQFWED